jgi:hypothetical protein
MRAYTVTAEDKRATLLLAGWHTKDAGGRERWLRPGEDDGYGLALDSAYATWRGTR